MHAARRLKIRCIQKTPCTANQLIHAYTIHIGLYRRSNPVHVEHIESHLVLSGTGVTGQAISLCMRV